MSSKNKNGTSSIARSINMSYWLQQLGNYIFLNLVIVTMITVMFFIWAEGQLPEGLEDLNRSFAGESGKLQTAVYIISSADGQEFRFALKPVLDFCRVPAIVLLSTEGLMLFGSLFSVSMVRKKLKPLNQVAMKMEELTNISAGGADLKTMEEAIEKLNPDMPGARVTTGDKELQSLEIAINNMLERMRESHRQQERFVSDASHELRTPIAVIQGYVNMLDRWGKDDEQILRESIEALKNESEHMKNLVEQLLFLARGDSGRQTLNMAETDIAEIVREVMEESSMIDGKHEYCLAGGPLSVKITGDGAMLKQALRIFVQNAAKYSNEGDTITLKAGLDNGVPFYSVQDEGIGMQSSEVVHVFERFYRSDSARNSAEGGTGLGLSIAKWIVDAHGGVIEVLSRPDFGTRITVKFSSQL